MRSLLEARPPSRRDRLDLIRGAIDARLHPQGIGPERIPDRAGYVSLAAFALFGLTILVASNGPVQVDEYGTYRDGAAAMPIAFLAMLAMSFGLHRLSMHLPPEAAGARAGGWFAVVSGPIWALAPWMLLILVVFLMGVLVVIVGAWRAGLMPRWLTAGLVALLAAPFALLVAVAIMPWYELRQSGIPILIVFTPLFVLPILLGIRLLRGFPRPLPA
jgi:hypothetical protein